MLEKTKILSILILFPALILSRQKLSLDQCREMALQKNNEILARKEGIQAARDKEKAAFKNFLPDLNLEGNYTRWNKKMKYSIPELELPVHSFNPTEKEYQINYVTDRTGDRVINPQTGEPLPENIVQFPGREFEFGQENTYMFNLGLSQPLFTGGKIWEKYNISGYKKNIARLNEKLSEQEILYKISKYYWQVKALQQKVKLARQYREMVGDHLEDIKTYQEEGMVNQNDVLKARVKKSDAEVRILKAENGLQLARKTLCHYIGLPLNTNIVLTDSMEIQDSIDSNKEYKKIARKYRREIEILKQKENITSSKVNLIKAKYWPDLLLKAGYFGINPNPYNSFESEIGKDWRVSLNFSLPLFNWNKRGNELTAARHSREQIQYKIKDIKEKISLEVEKTINEVQQSRKIVAQRKLSLEQAKENLRIAEDNFEAGVIKSSELTEAQTMWRKAYTKYIESKKSHKVARAKLVRAIGKGLLNN